MSMKIESKQYTDIAVLIFGAGGRQALPICRGFYKLGCKVTAYCYQKTDTGYLTKFATSKILYDPHNDDKEDFMAYGARLIKKGEYDLVVPLGDATAMYLSQNKAELKKYAKIAVNDWIVFNNVIDKLNTMRICQEHHISIPKTVFSDNLIDDIEKSSLNYPVVVKPRTACGSIGFNIIKTKEKLNQYLSSYDNRNGPVLIQEYIPQNGPQYGGEVFRDQNGNFSFTLIDMKPRWYPLDGGSPTINLTVHNEEMSEICKTLLEALKWNGYANVDFVVDSRDGKAKVLEVNGRLSAATKIDYCAGIDVAKNILENEFDLPVTSFADYPDNIGIACFLSDLLWFVKSKNRFRSKPSWFNRKGVKDSIFDWTDIKPAIGFVYASFKDYKGLMKKRKRFE